MPAGIIIAIHGMETGFGHFMGDANVLSAIATLAYDCRRPDYFTPHLIAALILVDKGVLTPATVGAMHGEVGHTQFLPGNALKYGVDGDGDGRISLDGRWPTRWPRPPTTCAPRAGSPARAISRASRISAVIKEWNAATVYQQAIAVMGARIEP